MRSMSNKKRQEIIYKIGLKIMKSKVKNNEFI